jgi:H+/Cl- antiporter ClcA
MTAHESQRLSTTDGLPIAPSLGPTLEAAHASHQSASVSMRTVWLCFAGVALGAAGALVAQALTYLIALITNLSFFGRLSFEAASPADNALGFWVIGIPVLGALVVGVMARYGSKAIRGHGIPEAMEQVLFNKSRIPPRITFLKPVSAAIAIGTGGPFGAEGPIIATGGALGSMIGQWLPVSSDERKTLLAAGAAAGMAATFGSPVSAVLLAVELLLFEYKPRSVLPVALAASAATAVRIAFVGGAPAFEMPAVDLPGGGAMAFYVALGCVIGLASVFVTRAVYLIEDMFEKLPVHWMWWPAIGAIAVGLVGFFAPRTLGVGYTNIEDILSGRLVGSALLLLCILKFVSWSIALGSGTSGGTLAPLFTIGGALGALVGAATASLLPELGVDARVAALVGMAAIFAGASRALLASIVFAFETTRQPLGLLPLLAGCSTSYLVSALMMRNSIMTEKLARRGARVLTEYGADFLASVPVMEAATKQVRTLKISQTVKEAREWTESGLSGVAHQGFPVVSDTGALMGVLTRRDLGNARDEATLGALITRAPVAVFEDQSLREAEDAMVRQNVGRLPVVKRDEPTIIVGILTRSDLLRAHAKRLAEG